MFSPRTASRQAERIIQNFFGVVERVWSRKFAEMIRSLLPLILVFSGCVSPFYKFKEKVYLGRNISIEKIESTKFPSEKIQESIPAQIAYPVPSIDELSRILWSLKFTRKGIISDDHGRVFHYSQLTEISEQLSDSFRKLDNKHRALLIARFDLEKVVFNRPDRTTMILWADQSGLNLILGEIREPIPDGTDSLDPAGWTSISPVDLAKAPRDLKLDDSTLYDFKRIGGTIHNTWIIIPITKLAAFPPLEKEIENSPVTPESKPQEIDLAKKLAGLKEAYDKKLITKEEYEAKRKKLIDGY